MLLILGDEHKQHLEYLCSASLDVVQEFCRLSVEFLMKGTNTKIYNSAAQKLGVEAIVIQKAIEGLMHLFLESSKLLLNEIDFRDSVKAAGFSDELQSELLRCYLENQADIRRIQLDMSMGLPHYRDLEWRLDVKLASRSLRHQVEPVVTMKLHVQDSGKEETKLLQTDPANLVHITRTLEEALQELNSAHCRRICRNF